MPWNEKDFTRWRAQSYARLGPDICLRSIVANGSVSILTVPANHSYLLRNWGIFAYCDGGAGGTCSVAIMRVAVILYKLFEGPIWALNTKDHVNHSCAYPIEMIAGDFLRSYSSNANTVIESSIHYTDVDLTAFPAYDPGY